ncbi:hypothetical protein D770_25565 [Flammeovirgaceae bacterium 311]|nr:hypothetical protein D770_25565 [Flammeovirgaceae bacterium 311]
MKFVEFYLSTFSPDVMQKITTLLLFFVCTLSMVSCMNYQYNTVSSNLEANENQEFYLENDSLIIKYSFYGDGGPVHISIYNKMEVPLYVDWKRSALVLNDQSHTYWQNKSSLEATEQGHQVSLTPMITSSSATISGEIRGDEATAFIAPMAYSQADMLRINLPFLDFETTEKEHRVKVNTKEGLRAATRYQYAFEDSPLKFRSYLTISTDPTFTQASTYESTFWVADLVQTKAKPEDFLHEKKEQNKFYTSKSNGAGTFLGIIGILVLVLAMSGGN